MLVRARRFREDYHNKKIANVCFGFLRICLQHAVVLILLQMKYTLPRTLVVVVIDAT